MTVRLTRTPQFVMVRERWHVRVPPGFVGATATVRRKDGQEASVLLDDFAGRDAAGWRLYRCPVPDSLWDEMWERDFWDPYYDG